MASDDARRTAVRADVDRAWPARPTARCLTEDLVADWDDPEQMRAAGRGEYPVYPLHAVGHPLVRHAAGQFTAQDNVEVARESITSAEPLLWKVKSGRWRGAVSVDEDGQAWLVAAGLRREGDVDDFYAALESAGGAPGPTIDDRRRLALERARADIDRWKLRIHEQSIEAVFEAFESRMPSSFAVYNVNSADDLCGVQITIEIVESDDGLEDEGLVETTIEVRFSDWASLDLVEIAQRCAMTAIDSDEQAWNASGVVGTTMIVSTVSLVGEFTTGVREAADRPAGVMRPGSVSHYTHRHGLTESTVEGDPVRGMCGVWFVPRRDPNQHPVCRECESLFTALT